MEDIKQKIIAEVSEMLESGMAAEEVTVREITKRLGISVSTINYHFGSKDALMNQVIKMHIDKVIAKVPGTVLAMEGIPPREKLLKLVKYTAGYLAKSPSVSRISILNDLKSGFGKDNTFGSIRAYEPLVKEIAGPEKADIYGMILAFTLQGMFLRTDVLRDEGILDYDNTAERDRAIEDIFDIVFPLP